MTDFADVLRFLAAGDHNYAAAARTPAPEVTHGEVANR